MASQTLAPTSLWALIEIAKVARAIGGATPACDDVTPLLPTQPLDRADASLTIQELYEAGVHSDESVRIAALELLCTSHRSTSLPSPDEMDLMKVFLPLALKSPEPRFRHRMSALFTRFVSRLHEGSRVCARDRGMPPSQRRKELRKRGIKLPDRATQARDAMLTLQKVSAFLDWLVHFLLDCSYPGSPFSRVGTALDLLKTVVQIWGFKSVGDVDVGVLQPLRALNSPRSCKTLLSCIESCWELTRSQVSCGRI